MLIVDRHKIGRALAKGVVDLIDDGAERACAISAVIDTERVEHIAKHARKAMEIDFDLICGNNISTLNADALELPVDWEHHQKWGILKADSLLGEPHPIFAKLETPSDLSS